MLERTSLGLVKALLTSALVGLVATASGCAAEAEEDAGDEGASAASEAVLGTKLLGPATPGTTTRLEAVFSRRHDAALSEGMAFVVDLKRGTTKRSLWCSFSMLYATQAPETATVHCLDERNYTEDVDYDFTLDTKSRSFSLAVKAQRTGKTLAPWQVDAFKLGTGEAPPAPTVSAGAVFAEKKGIALSLTNLGADPVADPFAFEAKIRPTARRLLGRKAFDAIRQKEFTLGEVRLHGSGKDLTLLGSVAGPTRYDGEPFGELRYATLDASGAIASDAELTKRIVAGLEVKLKD